MNTSEIILISILGAITLLTTVLNFLQKALIERYRLLLKDYYDRLNEVYANDNEVLKYCLMQIMKQSIESEDYETAHKCQDLLNTLQKVNQ